MVPIIRILAVIEFTLESWWLNGKAPQHISG